MTTFYKKLTSVALIISFLVPMIYAPVFAPRAQAIFGAADVNIESIPQLLDYLWQKIGKHIAKKMVDDMVKSTISWANTGFDGNPAYPNDWEQYLKNTASGEAGNFIANEAKLGFLCEPFQAQIRLSLVRQTVPPASEYECTIEKIGGNFEDFVDDFDGGWKAFFDVTQSESGNPISAFVTASADLDERVANQLGVVTEERNINLGFLNSRDCVRTNVQPPASTVALYEAASAADQQKILQGLMVSVDGKTVLIPKGSWDPSKANGACLEQGPVKTPGSVIKTQLDSALGSGLQGLIDAEDLDALISAFASGLLQRYVFGPKGLFADDSSGAARNEVIDIDRDRIPDGYDYNQDEELDICHHGIKNPDEPPSNDNCIASKGAVNSPYFAQICEASSFATDGLKKYQRFMDQNQRWDPTYYGSWLNRTTDAQQAVDDFINAVSKIENIEFVKISNNFNMYSNHLGVMINSLVKDKDLRGDGLSPGILGAGAADTYTISKTSEANRERLAYLESFVERIGQCDDPDIDAIRGISLPPDINGSSTEPTTGSSSLSCTTFQEIVAPEETVVWRMQTTYNDATEFLWEGDDVNVATTSSPQNLFISYQTTGNKEARITAFFATSTPITRSCDATVTVTNQGI